MTDHDWIGRIAALEVRLAATESRLAAAEYRIACLENGTPAQQLPPVSLAAAGNRPVSIHPFPGGFSTGGAGAGPMVDDRAPPAAVPDVPVQPARCPKCNADRTMVNACWTPDCPGWR